MPLPVALAITYLAVNLAITIWIVREDEHGRAPRPGVMLTSRLLRYGPALLGLFYLVTIAGDWPFFLFVIVFFGIAFFLLNGLLSTPSRPPK
jgi:hypothetical protein